MARPRGVRDPSTRHFIKFLSTTQSPSQAKATSTRVDGSHEDRSRLAAPVSGTRLDRGDRALFLGALAVLLFGTAGGAWGRDCKTDGGFKTCRTCRDRKLTFPCLEVMFTEPDIAGIAFEVLNPADQNKAMEELKADWGPPAQVMPPPISMACWDSGSEHAGLAMRSSVARAKAGTLVLIITDSKICTE